MVTLEILRVTSVKEHVNLHIPLTCLKANIHEQENKLKYIALTFSVRGPTLDVYIRQILTPKVDPRTERVNYL